jgi:predicted ATP-grasp superfamily ATP-dependent carboligase
MKHNRESLKIAVIARLENKRHAQNAAEYVIGELDQSKADLVAFETLVDACVAFAKVQVSLAELREENRMLGESAKRLVRDVEMRANLNR